MVLAESVDSNIQTGITEYRQQNFDQAEINFSNALKEKPDSPELNYNLANSHYKTGKFEEALKSYSDAASSETTPDLKQNSLYNSGNALFRMGKLEESIEAYKKVLEMNPGDMDAKFNLEFARLKLREQNKQEQKQNQPQEENPDNRENSGENADNQGDNNQEDTAQKDNQEPAPPKEPEDDPSEQQESNPSELAQDSESSISKDQAEQWLSGLDEDLKKFSQKQAHEEGANAPVASRDW